MLIPDMLSKATLLSLPRMAVVKSRALRIILTALGWLWIGVAFIGVFLPLIPTVGPILLAGFFFSRSSDRIDRWLVSNRYFGQTILDWRAGVGFSVRAKIIAVVSIAASFTISVSVVTEHLGLRIGLIALGVTIALYVVSRPTKRRQPETSVKGNASL